MYIVILQALIDQIDPTCLSIYVAGYNGYIVFFVVFFQDPSEFPWIPAWTAASAWDRKQDLLADSLLRNPDYLMILCDSRTKFEKDGRCPIWPVRSQPSSSSPLGSDGCPICAYSRKAKEPMCGKARIRRRCFCEEVGMQCKCNIWYQILWARPLGTEVDWVTKARTDRQLVGSQTPRIWRFPWIFWITTVICFAKDYETWSQWFLLSFRNEMLLPVLLQAKALGGEKREGPYKWKLNNHGENVTQFLCMLLESQAVKVGSFVFLWWGVAKNSDNFQDWAA